MLQYNLNFCEVEDFLEENYIVSSSNIDAYNLIIKNFPSLWSVMPYPKALLLLGDKSSGKSHLSSIWAQKFKAETNITIDTKPSNILLDNIENYDQTLLLHLFNHCHEEGKFLLMTSSSIPNFSLNDLKSRINSVNIVRIYRPDQDMIRILLIRAFSKRSMKVPAKVIDYLASRITRDCKNIKDTVSLLDSISSSYKKKITIPFIKEYIDI